MLLDPLNLRGDAGPALADKKSANTQNAKSQSSTLQLKIVEATLTRDTEMVGHMDPFIKVECDGRDYRTKVI